MRDRLETLIGWIAVLGILFIAFQPQTYVFPEDAQAALITGTDGTVLRPEQNWDNRNFLKSRNLRETVIRTVCPDDPTASCIYPSRPDVMYLGPDHGRPVFYHEYFHSLYRSGLYSGPLWVNEEITADLYSSCAMKWSYPGGYYIWDLPGKLRVQLYKVACTTMRRYIH